MAAQMVPQALLVQRALAWLLEELLGKFYLRLTAQITTPFGLTPKPHQLTI
jgi:hypothetical protein